MNESKKIQNDDLIQAWLHLDNMLRASDVNQNALGRRGSLFGSNNSLLPDFRRKRHRKVINTSNLGHVNQTLPLDDSSIASLRMSQDISRAAVPGKNVIPLRERRASNSLNKTTMIPRRYLPTGGKPPGLNSILDSSITGKKTMNQTFVSNCGNETKTEGDIEIRSIPRSYIQELYLAKCRDFDMESLDMQANRFVEKIKSTCKHRVFSLREMQLGLESAKAISKILSENFYFTHVDISKNNFGDKGIAILTEGIAKNSTIVKLNIASNALSPKGADLVFSSLLNHKSLAFLNISSFEGLNRNRLGTTGVTTLEKVLGQNPVLQFLDLSATALTLDGLSYICKGLDQQMSGLSYLNLSNNIDLGPDAVIMLNKVMMKAPIIELNLSNTKLGDQGCMSFTQIFRAGRANISLEKLDISSNGITCVALIRFFDSLSKNLNLTKLNLSNNPLTGRGIGCIVSLLWDNTVLTHLEMNACKLEAMAGDFIASGIARNSTIEVLSLAKNILRDDGAKFLSGALGEHPSLKYLDLSSNSIKSEGGIAISHALKTNNVLTDLLLHDNSLGNDFGYVLTDALQTNKSIKRMTLQLNGINHRYRDEVEKILAVNLIAEKKNVLPKSKEEKEKLVNFQALRSSIEEEVNYNVYREKEVVKALETEEEEFRRCRVFETKKNEELEQILEELQEELGACDRERAALDLKNGEAHAIFQDLSRKLEQDLAHYRNAAYKFEQEIKDIIDSMGNNGIMMNGRIERKEKEAAEEKRRATLAEASFKAFEGKVVDLKKKVENMREDDKAKEEAFKLMIQQASPSPGGRLTRAKTLIDKGSKGNKGRGGTEDRKNAEPSTSKDRRGTTTAFAFNETSSPLAQERSRSNTNKPVLTRGLTTTIVLKK